jgi:hypothetical protein
MIPISGRIVFRAAISWALTFPLGCSSDGDSGGGGGSGGLGADSVATQFAKDYCALLQPCCQQAGLSNAMTSCLVLMSQTPADATAAQECLDAYKQRAGQAD